MDPDALDGEGLQPADATGDTSVDSETNTDTGGDATGDAPTAFDWTGNADQLVTVKVDGQDVQVTLREAMDGYSRQADYTRKAQALASEREQLATARQIQQALAKDPKATLAVLAELYGDSAEAEVEDDLDPIEVRLRKMEAAEAARSASAQRDAIITEANAALGTAQLNGQVTANELLQYATDNMIGRLDVAARLMASERRAATKKAADDKALSAKKDAQVVEGANGRTKSAAPAAAPKTFKDAALLAMQQLGFTS